VFNFSAKGLLDIVANGIKSLCFFSGGLILVVKLVFLFDTQPFRFLRFCQSVKLALCRTLRFAVLPECRSYPGVSPRRCFARVIAKSYLIRTVIQF